MIGARVPCTATVCALVALLLAPVATPAPVDPPVLAPVPEFIGSAPDLRPEAVLDPAQRITWTAPAMTRCRSYQVEISDLTTGAVRLHEVLPAVDGSGPYGPDVAPPAHLRFGPRPYAPRDATDFADLTDGHVYRFRVRGVERAPGSAPAPWISGPFENCRGVDTGPPEPGPYGAPSSPARHDARDPVVVAVVAGGAGAVGTRATSVHLRTLTDPDPPGVPGAASGIAGVTVDGVPRPAVAGARHPVRLGGADGVKSVVVAARDRVGHVTTVRDEVVLDRTPPRVVLRQAAPRVRRGALAAFDAGTSADRVAADGSSAGLRPTSFRWRFGDGLPGAITPAATHVFTRRGVFCGEVTVRDRAGNVGRRTFATRVESGGALLGDVRARRHPAGLTVDVCLARRAAVVVRADGRRGGRTRRAVGGPGVVRLRVPVAGRAATLRVAAGDERRTVPAP